MKIKVIILSSIVGILLLSGCNQTPSPTQSIDNPIETNVTISTDTDSIPETDITMEPEPTEPLIASINNEGIWLRDFEEEIQRYLSAAEKLQKEIDNEQARTTVLDTMIDTVLLAQGARDAGFTIDQQSYDGKLQSLIVDVGSESQFQQWLIDNKYSPESFERIYKLQLEAAWMRDVIINKVPTRAEQIRARQILVSGKTLADSIYSQLQNGADFDYYAWGYDQLAGGELGWFPRGYLILPQIEEAVFNLQPGEYTEVIESVYGFHIVQVLERELDRELTQDALIQKQREALMEWLTEQKSLSLIEITQG